jgi:hypothetical protein
VVNLIVFISKNGKKSLKITKFSIFFHILIFFLPSHEILPQFVFWGGVVILLFKLSLVLGL